MDLAAALLVLAAGRAGSLGIGGMARVLFPILFGFLYDRGSGLPFLVSAAMVLFTVYLGLGMEAYTRTDAKPAAAA